MCHFAMEGEHFPVHGRVRDKFLGVASYYYLYFSKTSGKANEQRDMLPPPPSPSSNPTGPFRFDLTNRRPSHVAHSSSIPSHSIPRQPLICAGSVREPRQRRTGDTQPAVGFPGCHGAKIVCLLLRYLLPQN
jgi:hypothetical protein